MICSQQYIQGNEIDIVANPHKNYVEILLNIHAHKNVMLLALDSDCHILFMHHAFYLDTMRIINPRDL